MVKRVVREALTEDLPSGRDLTTELLFGPRDIARGVFIVKAPGVVCGVDLLSEVFGELSGEVEVTPLVKDGDLVEPLARIAHAAGPVRALLAGERTALNLLCRLSGIATLTRAFVEKVRPLGTRVADTR
jgi:nicotinate-nucleotide pyrophosphorylase (carboxylating)